MSSSWILIIVSGFIETAWAIGLKASNGFTRPLPTVLTMMGMLLSAGMLALASRSIPIGTAYAVWVGIGAFGAVILGVVLYGDPITLGRAVSVLLLVAGIVGLKLTTAT